MPNRYHRLLLSELLPTPLPRELTLYCHEMKPRRSEAVAKVLRSAVSDMRTGPAAGAPFAAPLLFALAQALDIGGPLPSLLEGALVAALTAEIPVATEARLAAIVGCSRTTLWRMWRRAMDVRLSMADFLDIVLIARYEELRGARVPARVAAARLRSTPELVYEHRLRLKRRLLRNTSPNPETE